MSDDGGSLHSARSESSVNSSLYSYQSDAVVEKADKLKFEREVILNSSPLRQFLYRVIETKYFSGFILTVIFINTILIALQTVKEAVYKGAWYFSVIDQVFLGIYIMEMVFKLFVQRRHYFKSGWNWFDGIIVLLSVLDNFLPLIASGASTFNPKIFRLLRIFRAVRAMRTLRVLRTISFLRNLQVLVSTLLESISALGSITLLIWIVMYIFAVIGRGIYSTYDPRRWGNIGRACFTLFQMLTLDDWFFIYTDVALKHEEAQVHFFLYLFIFIILETFIFINLFAAVIVDNLTKAQKRSEQSMKQQKQAMNEEDPLPEHFDLDVFEKETKQERTRQQG
eukprot:Colp12_sorted_trinity150504_noHs@11681